MTNAIWEDLKLLFAHFHLAPKVVCLRERLSIVSIPSFRAMVNIFCLEKESGYILEISESFPKGTDFICNGVWRNLSLRILLKTVRGMVIKKKMVGNGKFIEDGSRSVIQLVYQGEPGKETAGRNIIWARTNLKYWLFLQRNPNLIEWIYWAIPVLEHCWKQKSN